MERPWKELSAALGVSDTVHWPGFLQYEQLPAAYQFAGAFVHPARREPWGLVVNEAAAAGLPLLVGQHVGAACELVRDGENGFLVNPDDVERVREPAASHVETLGRRAKCDGASIAAARFGLWA